MKLYPDFFRNFLTVTVQSTVFILHIFLAKDKTIGIDLVSTVKYI